MPHDSADRAGGSREAWLRVWIRGNVARRHFEAGQKLDVTPLASGAALADALLFLWRAIGRPAFGQLVLRFCFVAHASLGSDDGSIRRFSVAVSGNIELR